MGLLGMQCLHFTFAENKCTKTVLDAKTQVMITIFAGAPFVYEMLFEILHAGETRNMSQRYVSGSLLLSLQRTLSLTPMYYGSI